MAFQLYERLSSEGELGEGWGGDEVPAPGWAEAGGRGADERAG